jgi:ribosomal protein S18 acetylase RimI-like enzyme
MCSVLEGARFERRAGYVWTVCPQIPIPSFNSVWPEDDVCAPALADALAEIVALGLPYSIQMRRERTPACEEAAEHMGLMPVEEIPAMLATADELRDVHPTELEVIRVATADGLAQALSVSAEGFAAPPEIFAPLYDLEVAALEGLEYYLGRVGKVDVATAVGFTTGNAVGIFNVATLPERRGRGYGAAITAQAARQGFRAGAEFAWLQSSAIGYSVYRRLGFRDVETYVLWTAPEAVPEAPEGLV